MDKHTDKPRMRGLTGTGPSNGPGNGRGPGTGNGGAPFGSSKENDRDKGTPGNAIPPMLPWRNRLTS